MRNFQIETQGTSDEAINYYFTLSRSERKAWLEEMSSAVTPTLRQHAIGVMPLEAPLLTSQKQRQNSTGVYQFSLFLAKLLRINL